MAEFFALLFLVSIILLIMGLKNPEKVIRWNAEKTKKNVWVYFGSVAFISFVVLGTLMPQDSGRVRGSNNTQSTNNDRAIPGLAAVDVHGNLTSRGFTLQTYYSDIQSEWKCTRKASNCDYSVEAFGSSPTEITSVVATINNFSNRSTRALASEFLGFLASLPYDGATPVEAKNWVQANVDRKAKKQFGPVVFETINYARWGRMLRITKAE